MTRTFSLTPGRLLPSSKPVRAFRRRRGIEFSSLASSPSRLADLNGAYCRRAVSAFSSIDCDTAARRRARERDNWNGEIETQLEESAPPETLARPRADQQQDRMPD